MSGKAKFWQVYAEMNDDIRHEVIERGWYGREVTEEAAQDAVIDAVDGPDHEGTVWEQENQDGIQSVEIEQEQE